MRALVGQFMLGGRAFRARPVDVLGQPTWLLRQLQCLFHDSDQDTRQELIELLLDYDWKLITTVVHWSKFGASFDPRQVVFVSDVGVGSNLSRVHKPQLYQLADEPDAGAGWAYLWDVQAQALHVYTAAHQRWHHVATFELAVLAAATWWMFAEIEERQQWALEAA